MKQFRLHSIFTLILAFLLLGRLSAQEANDLFIIRKMNMKQIRIGNATKTVESTFYLNEVIHWRGERGSMYVQNLRTKEFFFLTQEAFESKSAGSIGDYILTLKASTRSSSGQILYGHNKEKYGGEKRIALLIGNSNYLNESSLKNPISDVSSVSSALVEYGFDTYTYYDCSSSQMKTAVEQFRRKAVGSKVALFYFAGHGVSWENKYYYLPVDAELERVSSLGSCIEGYSLLRDLHADDRITLVLLDACRVRKRSWARGIVDEARIQMEAPTNMAIVFSTTDGSYALDGDGDLSPFAEGLLSSLQKGNVSFTDCSTEINRFIYEKTGHSQNSSLSSNLLGNFYFSSPTGGIVSPSVAGPSRPTQNVGTVVSPQPSYADPSLFPEGKRLYEQGDYAGSFRIMKALAENGVEDAYFYVADMYHRGFGVKKDRDEAEKWYKKAAAAGNAKARKILIDKF